MRPYVPTQRTGFTLIELLIAISLVGMIVLAIVAVDAASRRFVNSADYTARVQNQITPALEMISKDVSQATGDITSSGIDYSIGGIRIRVDTNTTATYDDDTWIHYNLTSNRIERGECQAASPSPCTPTSYSVIANNIVSATFMGTAPVNITITARRDVNLSVDSATNPEVTLQTFVFPRSSSLN